MSAGVREGRARRTAVLFLLLAGCAPRTMPTPAERAHFARPSTSTEIAAFVAELAADRPVAEVVPLGRSVGGRQMQALVLSKEPAAVGDSSTRLAIMVLASQHGTEPSGSEAVLRVARDVVDGPLAPLLDEVDLILVPDANPDGRDLHRRVNGRGVNLSTNFALLTEPEARAIHDALLRWRPAVLIDVHESAVFKGKTLARQGYVTDVEAQLETATHPDVDPGIAALSRTRVLPEVFARVNGQGLRAETYVREITDVGQPITAAGLSLRNLRNVAGLRDVMSFLIENRLDPKTGSYPTPRNLQARVEKQVASVRALLATCAAHREAIAEVVGEARRRALDSTAPLHLVTRYDTDPASPTVHIRLRRADTNEPVDRVFVHHRRVLAGEPLAPPAAYAVVAHQDAIGALLARHGVAFERVTAARPALVVAQRIRSRETVPGPYGAGWVTEYAVAGRATRVVVPAGALWVSLDQPARRLVPHLLEPGSSNSVFREPAYAPLVAVGEDFFIHRVPQ